MTAEALKKMPSEAISSPGIMRYTLTAMKPLTQAPTFRKVSKIIYGAAT